MLTNLVQAIQRKDTIGVQIELTSLPFVGQQLHSCGQSRDDKPPRQHQTR